MWMCAIAWLAAAAAAASEKNGGGVRSSAEQGIQLWRARPRRTVRRRLTPLRAATSLGSSLEADLALNTDTGEPSARSVALKCFHSPQHVSKGSPGLSKGSVDPPNPASDLRLANMVCAPAALA